MANIITGDPTKSIKGIGELALRISKFDSYRLFTLYADVKERKVMDVSGDQRYYLVFRSPKKEIRIPEYEPNGFFEVDKVNGCILFKITKKNAEDILSMRTAGDKIFHIIRVFEERDEFGKVLSIMDEVEVYNGLWGDDYTFSTYSTENKVDLLTKALATQIDKNANVMSEYNDLQETYNDEVVKNTNLEKEIEALRAERDSLQTQLNDIMGNTYDGTILSTDTKYIAFENTLDNVSFTEEQYTSALRDLLTKGEVDLTAEDRDEPAIQLSVSIKDDDLNGLTIKVYQNGTVVGIASSDSSVNKRLNIEMGDTFEFECSGSLSAGSAGTMTLVYTTETGKDNSVLVGEMIDGEIGELKSGEVSIPIKSSMSRPSIDRNNPKASLIQSANEVVSKTLVGKIPVGVTDSEGYGVDLIGSIGTLTCVVESLKEVDTNIFTDR